MIFVEVNRKNQVPQPQNWISDWIHDESAWPVAHLDELWGCIILSQLNIFLGVVGLIWIETASLAESTQIDVAKSALEAMPGVAQISICYDAFILKPWMSDAVASSEFV